MSCAVGFVCDQCESEVLSIARCDCFRNLCESCFATHSCGHEGFARWEYCPAETIHASEPPAIAVVPDALSSSLVAPRPYQRNAVNGATG